MAALSLRDDGFFAPACDGLDLVATRPGRHGFGGTRKKLYSGPGPVVFDLPSVPRDIRHGGRPVACELSRRGGLYFFGLASFLMVIGSGDGQAGLALVIGQNGGLVAGLLLVEGLLRFRRQSAAN